MKVESFRRKNIQMLATLMATATYAAGFNPPGGVWQDTAGHLPGDPVMRSTHRHRYQVFFYFNAAAFALSLMVVVVTLFLAARPKKTGPRFDLLLLLLMLPATVAFMVAYGTGACRDTFGVVVFSVMAVTILPTGLCQLCFLMSNEELDEGEKYRGNLIAPLSMFALTISYVGGLSTPGGFWDGTEGSQRPGGTILHGKLMHLFFFFNTAQFVSSLQCVSLVIFGGLGVMPMAFSLLTGPLALIVAYTVGSSRGDHATVGVICSLCAAVGACIIIHVVVRVRFSYFFEKLPMILTVICIRCSEQEGDAVADRRRRYSDVIQLLAGLAVSITYQAGMYPPGGIWQDGNNAGDPILQTTNPGRYRAFYYCNSVAFVASLLVILLDQKGYWTEHHALEATMILDLLALIVAYAIGSCRDQISSMYVLGIAAAAVVYVVVHVQYFTLGSGAATYTNEDDRKVEKKAKRLLIFAILVASMTYQAGLTPPGGFLLQDDGAGGHRVGDPVLLYNYPRRYKAFFYSNSVSFMVSTVLLLLIINPNMAKPAIRSHALSLCSGLSFVCLICAFAAGGTQHLKTTIYIFVFSAVVVSLCLLSLLLTIVYSYLPKNNLRQVHIREEQPQVFAWNNIYLMTIGILVGSVTYQAGLDPPGGSWQSGSHAGHPVMHDKRRNRYLAFLCGNTTSFVASIYLIEILIFSMYFRNFPMSRVSKGAIETLVVAQYLGFLAAYAAGSSRQWKTSAHVGTLVIAVLAYVATHVMLTICIKKKTHKGTENSLPQQDQAPSFPVPSP